MIDLALIEATTSVFEMALKETFDESQWDQAVQDIFRQVLERHPEIDLVWLAFSMGRALGKGTTTQAAVLVGDTGRPAAGTAGVPVLLSG
jgi:hypothetical protein